MGYRKPIFLKKIFFPLLYLLNTLSLAKIKLNRINYTFVKNNTFIVLAMFCGLLGSCKKWGNPENRHLMQHAQLLIEQMPDSALTLLDGMNTFEFNDAERAEYSLLKIQAKRNAGMDISSDAEIYDAREYFIRKKDPQKAALACFFAAVVAAEQKQIILAIEYYQDALEFVKHIDDNELNGKILYNIGYLNFGNGWFDDAITWYKQALEIFQMMDHQYQREVYTLNAIANSLMMNQQTDSAQFYYKHALDKAHLHEATALQVMVYNNMSINVV